MSEYLRSEVVEALRNGDAVVVAGAGVAMATCNGTKVASWDGLIDSGLSRCVDINRSLAGTWEATQRGNLSSNEAADKIEAAEVITRELKERPGNHYAKWLRDTVGSLRVESPGLPQILANLNAPIFTTNYDNLIEDASGRGFTTWKNLSEIQEEMRNPGNFVVHLHGHWRDPSSVVFGYKSYAEIIGDAGSQSILRSMLSIKSVIFIGYGLGLGDPNFGSLGNWLTSTLHDSGVAPVVLVRDSDYDRADRRYRQFGFNVLTYGPDYADLEIYLADLLADATASSTGSGQLTQFSWETLGPKLMRLHRRIERDYRADFIIAMSGPGNFAPAYCLAHSSSDPPLLTAVTFPKKPNRSENCKKFIEIANKSGWLHHESTRWDVFLPNLLKSFPPDSKALIFDDRAIGGRVQKEVANLLQDMGYEVKRAALVVHPDCAQDVDYYEEMLSGDFVFPWGGKYGRNEPPA